MSHAIIPRRIRLEACAACQLRCPSCPVHGRGESTIIGNGFLRLSAFEELLQANPQLRRVELSNYGEMFLNPELPGILRCAHEHNVALTANNGVNFNTASGQILDGLVKYHFESMTCSIDGATEETYGAYRVGGSLEKVLNNIRALNAIKVRYGSELPKLQWQFVVFGHNEHEIPLAREMARDLDMRFRLKLSWDPLLSPVRDEALVRSEIGVASRKEYERIHGSDYRLSICHQLWTGPQINWDGGVLGCCRNHWSPFEGNAFTDGLVQVVNSPGMQYARGMLLGKQPPADGIPCSTCRAYMGMKERGKWLDSRVVEPSMARRAARSVHDRLRRSRMIADLIDRIRA